MHTRFRTVIIYNEKKGQVLNTAINLLNNKFVVFLHRTVVMQLRVALTTVQITRSTKLKLFSHQEEYAFLFQRTK